MASVKKDIVEVCRKLHEKNFLAGTDGNVSARCKSRGIFITPSGLTKSSLKTSDICRMDLKGRPLKGNPSSEKAAHLVIYQERNEAGAVVHAHPPFAVSLSLSRPQWKILPPFLPEGEIVLGKVPFVPYSCPGTESTAAGLRPFLKDSRAFILSRHGAVTWGESLESAYLTMECLEHSARIIYLAESLGGARELSDRELSELRKLSAGIKPCP